MMKLQQVIMFFLVSVWACHAGKSNVEVARSLGSNLTVSGSNSVESSNSTTVSNTTSVHSDSTKKTTSEKAKSKSKHHTDDDATNADDDANDDMYSNDDDSTAVLPVGNFNAPADDDSTDKKDETDKSEPEHIHFSMDEKSNATLFTPPEEVEPPFWKPFVFCFFLLCALILCILTARKSCCDKKGYQEIPSTTLVV